MKKTTLFAIAFGCLTALGLTSCLDDDNNNNNSSRTLTPTEVAQCYSLVKGHYQGDMLYRAVNPDNALDQTDTVSVSWNIPNDSTLIIENFPAKALAEAVTSKAVKEVLAEAPAQEIKCFIGFISVSPVQFLIYPYTLDYALHYGDKDHKIQVAFYVNTTYSYGSYDATDNSLVLQIIAASIYEDGTQVEYLTSATPFCFIAKQ